MTFTEDCVWVYPPASKHNNGYMTLGAYLLMILFILLWTILLVISGIVAAFPIPRSFSYWQITLR